MPASDQGSSYRHQRAGAPGHRLGWEVGSLLLIFRILPACQLSLGLSATPQVFAGSRPRILSFCPASPSSPQLETHLQPGSREQGSGSIQGRGCPPGARASSTHPSTHPLRPGCPRRTTPPGSGRRSSPLRASENLEPGGARLALGMQRLLLPGSQLTEWGRA